MTILELKERLKTLEAQGVEDRHEICSSYRIVGNVHTSNCLYESQIIGIELSKHPPRKVVLLTTDVLEI